MQTAPSSTQGYAGGEIDLRQLVTVLWRQKALIAGIGIFGALLGAGASLYSKKYVTEEIFLTPGISAGNYKRYQTVFSSGPRLQQYLQSSGLVGTTDGDLLYELAENQDALRDTLKPEFAFTDTDQKTFGVKVTEKDEPGVMIGMRIQFKHKKPTHGAPVTLLGEYVRDTIIRVNFEKTLPARCAEFRAREQKLRNAQIDNDFAITQEEKRAATLRDIIARNPAAAAVDNRQIVSLEKGGERFLSPVAQLVAAEIQIADMRLAEARRERDRIRVALKRDYYCQAQQALQQTTHGRAFLEELKNVQTAVFQGQDKTIDIVERTWNELDVERKNWINTYLQAMRFVASPEGAEVKVLRKPGLALGVALGGMLGGMLVVFGALVRMWWRGEEQEKAGA
jgi:hypothetical protein